MKRRTVKFIGCPGLRVSAHVGPDARRVDIIVGEELELPEDDPRVDLLDEFCTSPSHPITTQPKERPK